MIEFKTLKGISTEQILDTFNLSFSDYLVPLQLTKEQFKSKLESEGFKPELSAGAFKENQLIAFILHGSNIVNGVTTTYNGGTGVIPTERGNRLTKQLYEFILPNLKKEGFHRVQLEVITNNIPAIKTYKCIGFEIKRVLNCYKGEVEILIDSTNIIPLESYQWESIQQFWDFVPTWQNSITAVELLKKQNVSIGIARNDDLVGYLIYNPKVKRVHQFGVHKKFRGKGLGKQLFCYITNQFGPELSIINVDSNNRATNLFLKNIGLKCIVQQYEMAYSINT